MADAQLRLDDAKPEGLRGSEGLQKEDLQKLVAEHHELDERIHRLATQSYLTERQQFEEVQLKKLKLALKDRIEAVLRSTRQMSVPSQSSA